MNLILVFVRQEFNYCSKNFGTFLQNILFFIICAATFLMLLQNLPSLENKEFFAQIIIWFSLLFAIFFANTEILQQDFLDGTLEQMLIYCENFESYIFSKIMASWLIFSLPIILTTPILLVLFGFEITKIKHLTLILIFASIAINFVVAFCSGINIVANKSPLIAILALPLLVPTLLLSFAGNVQLLAAIAIFLGAISVFALAKIVKITLE